MLCASGQSIFSINYSYPTCYLSIVYCNNDCVWASWDLSVNRALSSILYHQQFQGSFHLYSQFTEFNILEPFYSQFSQGSLFWGCLCSRITRNISNWLNQSNAKPIACDNNPLVSKNSNDVASTEPSNTENILDKKDYVAFVKTPNSRDDVQM